MSAVGWVQHAFAFVAVVAGALVYVLPKGTRWHRTAGHTYASAMVGVVATAFAIYDLFGGFGPFHVVVLASAATLVPALAFVLLRRPRGRWMQHHAGWMVASYVGLMCAFAAEAASRWIVPRAAALLPEAWRWALFLGSVVAATAAVGWLGGLLSKRYLPRSLARTRAAMRREGVALRRADAAAVEKGRHAGV